MGRDAKKRKKLILIGIVCDEEVNEVIDVKSGKGKSKMVKKNKLNYRFLFKFFFLFK